MLSGFSTVIHYHDARLVVLAALVCLLACYTAFSMMARLYAQRSRFPWVVSAAVVTGCGAWATQSMALLAFKPGVPMSYDVGLTVASGLIAVLGSGLGFHIARSTERMALGGAIVGFAIGAMHYVGIAALKLQAQVGWDIIYLQVAILTGASFGAAALSRAQLTPDVRGRVMGSVLLTAGICGTHFIGMAGLTLVPDASIAIPDDTLAIVWFSIALTTVVLLIVGLGIVSTLVDQHMQQIEVAKRELEAALSLADSASKSKTKFLSAISHELRSPLDVIVGSSDVMKKETLGPQVEHYRYCIDSIQDSSARLSHLVNDILDIARCDAGQLRLEDEFLDVGECVLSAVQRVQPDAEKAGLQTSIVIEKGLPKLCGDGPRIRQILLNLLSNAIRFTPEGGEVRVSAFRQDDGLALSVADTGVGMAEGDIPKVLEIFGQLENNLRADHKGVGLGLPLAQHLTELHGGTLRIASKPGAGTTVTVAFPARRIVRDYARIQAA